MSQANSSQVEEVNKANGLTVLGFDTGKNTGVAAYRAGKLAHLRTLKPSEVGDFLDYSLAHSEVVQVVFEDSRLQRALFTAEKGAPKTEGAKKKISRDVGYIDGLCEWLQYECDKRGIRCLGVSPADKGVKVAPSAFEHHTGWTKRCNQHERDAAMVAKPFRKGFAA